MPSPPTEVLIPAEKMDFCFLFSPRSPHSSILLLTFPSAFLHNSTFSLIIFLSAFTSVHLPSLPHPSNLTTFSLTLSLPSPLPVSFPPTYFHFFLPLPLHIFLHLFTWLVSDNVIFQLLSPERECHSASILVHLWFHKSFSRLSPLQVNTSPHTTEVNRDLQWFWTNRRSRSTENH